MLLTEKQIKKQAGAELGQAKVNLEDTVEVVVEILLEAVVREGIINICSS